MSSKLIPVFFLLASVAGCARGTAQIVATACGAECGGCCDANGQCLEGNAPQACGLDGMACMVCDGACFDGQCQGSGGNGGGAGGSSGSGGGAGGGGDEPDAGSFLCPPDGWCLENPAPDGTTLTSNILRGVFAINPNDVWVVGDRGTALHFDGQGWASKPPPGSDDLFAVYAFSPNDVWVAGGSGWPTGPVGVVFHWNGSTWTEKLRGTQRLDALWGSAPNDLWAVGYGGEMQHWDGNTWTGFPKVTTEAITAIHGRGPNKAWAVGSSGLVMQWDGAAWSVVPNSEQSGFAAVWAFSDSQVWALGGNGVSQAFNGTNWQSVPLGQSNTVLGFWAASPIDGWGVGPDTLLRFSSTAPARKLAPSPELLLDVHGSDPRNVWAVGFKGTVMRYRR